jgi:type IV pilus assembly protein PilQ
MRQFNICLKIIGIGLLWIYIISANAIVRDPFALAPPPSSSISSPMARLLIPIHYADANAIADFLNHSQHHIISAMGYATVDIRTNQLWIEDQRVRLPRIISIIKSLDIPIAQVLIKTRIVSVDNNFLHSLGLLFNEIVPEHVPSANHLTLDMPNSTMTTGVANIPIIKFSNGHILDLTLTALEQEGHATLISTPQLMTINRQAAMIESGEEVPYQEKTGQGNTSVAFKKATLRLKITPIILPENHILLQLAVNQDKISSLVVNGVPAIRTQQLETAVMLKDQETVVLGGIYEEAHQNDETGIPGLRKMPVIGGLFRQRQHSTARKQLLIFVTPRIINTR